MSYITHFSSTDSAVDVEAEFNHNLKAKAKKKRKRRSNLALNQSRKKKKKFDYGESVIIKKPNTDSDINTEECELTEVGEVLSNSLSVGQPEIIYGQVEATVADDSVLEEISVTQESNSNSEAPLSFLQRSIQQCKETLIEQVIGKFDKENLLIHFMSFMNMIANGQLSVVNMSVLLSMELALLLSLASTTQMRYRDETALFWEVVLSVGGPRTLRLFSSDKHVGSVNSGKCEKSKYVPSKGNFNFAVPDEKILRKSRTGLPKVLKCGIIEEAIPLLDPNKEYVLSLDGKQTSPGLLNESEGDVNLWGYEGPPTLQQNLDKLGDEENVILEIVNSAARDDNCLDDFVADLKYVVQIITKRICSLRQAKVRYEQLRGRFKKKIYSHPEIGSRYSIAFSDIDCFIRRADMAIKRLLECNVRWCEIMASINDTSHCFRKNGPILLDSLPNSWILRHPDTLQLDAFLLQYPHYMKQRSELWEKLRNKSLITGSTMHNALGLRTLKAQKEHFKQFVHKSEEKTAITPAMQHGIDYEVLIKIIHRKC